MPLKFFSNLFTSKEKKKTSETGPPEDQYNHAPMRRLSSSKSGKLKIKKEKNSLIIDDKFYAHPDETEKRPDSDRNDSVRNSKPYEEDINPDEVIQEIYDVARRANVT